MITKMNVSPVAKELQFNVEEDALADQARDFVFATKNWRQFAEKMARLMPINVAPNVKEW